MCCDVCWICCARTIEIIVFCASMTQCTPHASKAWTMLVCCHDGLDDMPGDSLWLPGFVVVEINLAWAWAWAWVEDSAITQAQCQSWLRPQNLAGGLRWGARKRVAMYKLWIDSASCLFAYCAAMSVCVTSLVIKWFRIMFICHSVCVVEECQGVLHDVYCAGVWEQTWSSLRCPGNTFCSQNVSSTDDTFLCQGLGLNLV